MINGDFRFPRRSGFSRCFVVVVVVAVVFRLRWRQNEIYPPQWNLCLSFAGSGEWLEHYQHHYLDTEVGSGK